MVKKWLKSKLIIIAIGLVVAILLGICLGSVHIALDEIISSIWSSDYTVKKAIIYDIRLPRVWMAVLVGANLSASGALLQAVMRNPLADPGITGVSAGASLLAIIILLLFPTYVALVPIAAFVGGIIACGIVYMLAWKNGR